MTEHEPINISIAIYTSLIFSLVLCVTATAAVVFILCRRKLRKKKSEDVEGNNESALYETCRVERPKLVQRGEHIKPDVPVVPNKAYASFNTSRKVPVYPNEAYATVNQKAMVPKSEKKVVVPSNASKMSGHVYVAVYPNEAYAMISVEKPKVMLPNGGYSVPNITSGLMKIPVFPNGAYGVCK